MAYDEGLAERVRDALVPANAREIRMFGGLAFMVRDHMCCGVMAGALMARVGPDAYPAALRRAHVRKMEFTGRPLVGYVLVDPPGIEADEDLTRWLDACVTFARSLPAKGKEKAKEKGKAKAKGGTKSKPARKGQRER
jgi:hypothetical protein